MFIVVALARARLTYDVVSRTIIFLLVSGGAGEVFNFDVCSAFDLLCDDSPMAGRVICFVAEEAGVFFGSDLCGIVQRIDLFEKKCPVTLQQLWRVLTSRLHFLHLIGRRAKLGVV